MAANRDLGKLRVDLELNSVSFAEGAAKAEKSMSGLGSSLQGFAKVATASVGFGALAAGMAKAVGAANELNASMANVASLMPGNAAQVGVFRSAIQDLSIESGKSTQDLAAGMYQVISAYGSGADAVERLRIVTEASQAGLSSTSDALSLLSVVTKSYGDESTEAMTKASDLAFKTVQLGQTTFPELAHALQNVASESSRAGVSQQELFSAFAATTGVIGNASVVSTKMKAAIEALSKPTADMAQLYKQLGVESGAALIKQEGLQGAFQIITETAAKSKIPLGNLISSIEGQSFAASIAGAQSEKFATSLAAMGGAAGTTKAALAEQTDGINAVGHALDQLGTAGVVALQAIGDAIMRNLGAASLGAIHFLTEGLESLTKLLSKEGMERGFIAQEFVNRADKLNSVLKDSQDYVKKLRAEIDNPGWFTNISNANEQLDKYNKKLQQTQKEIDLNNAAMRDWYAAASTGYTAPAASNQFAESIKEVVKESTVAKLAMGYYNGVVDKASELARKATEANKPHGVTLTKISEEAKKAADAMKALKEKYADTLSNIEKSKVGDAFQVAIKNEDWRGLDELGRRLEEETYTSIVDGLDESIKNDESALEYARKMAQAISSDKVKQSLAEIEKIKMDGINKEKEEREKNTEKLKDLQIKADKEAAEQRQKQLDAYYEAASKGMNILADAIKTGEWEKAATEAGLSVAESMANAFAPGSGALVRPAAALADSLYSSIFKAGGNADTSARSAIESFLEDTLSSNVVFSDGIQANWSDAFMAIAGDGETAFESLGAAISIMAGQTADMGGQVGFILAQNLNGNLDAARLLVQSLGLDAESMGQALADAANRGEITWGKWAALQSEVNSLTEKGLVGAGDLVGAWNQFLQTGNEGKGALISLQAVAIEAGEAGASSLSDLQAKMRALGISQQDVDRFIQQLAANGIKNVADLANASEDTLRQIAGGIENAGQEWSNFGEGVQSAIDQMSELEQKVRGIKDKEIDLTVNLHYKTVEGNAPDSVTKAAFGGVFENVRKFASGGIVSQPTYFGFGSGSVGLMGEAPWKEAVVPLGDGNRMVVRGLGGEVFNISIDARGAAPGVGNEIRRAINEMGQAAVARSVKTVVQLYQRGAL